MTKLLKKLWKWIIFIILSGGIVWGASINVLTIHSHPKEGDFWKVSFETQGLRDLIITPEDQNTIDDMDFVSLKCGDEERIPQILENDVILYENWYCFEEAEIVHIINRTDHHYLKFQFGDQEVRAYNAPDIIDNLISYWKLDDTDDTNALDAHGENDGTQEGGVTDEAAGKINTAFDFDGINGYVETPSITISSFSFVAWIKTTDSTQWAGIISTDDSSGNFAQIVISDTGTLRYDIGVGIDPGDRDRGDGQTTINDGEWYHIALVRDNGGDTNKLYVNGVEDDVDVSSDDVDSFSDTDELRIGTIRDEALYIDGIIDEAGIWDRALIQSEITALYNSGAGLAYPFTAVARRIIIIE